MTRDQIRLQHKLTVLNEIRKMYKSTKGFGHDYWDGTITEQRDYDIGVLINDLEKELKK